MIVSPTIAFRTVTVQASRANCSATNGVPFEKASDTCTHAPPVGLLVM